MTAAAGVVAGCTGGGVPAAETSKKSIRYDRIVDLTHTLREGFPTYFGTQQLEIESLFTAEKDGFNLKRWTINEHTGTHLDSPFHFGGEHSADEIPITSLIGPLAVVDIRQKAAENADAQVTADDLKAWEASNGELPPGVIVAMNSGWGAYVNDNVKFRNTDAEGTMHFPGFHIDAIEYLIGDRDAAGIMVDTLSLDFGASPDFAVHYRWLPTNHWGVECAANLGDLPASGATVFVGGPKIERATGGPSRIVAFV